MKIAIITVCYNDCSNLSRTFKSIKQNKTENHNYYVIDGKSNDGSYDLINLNLDIIDNWRSERDTGLYDAMNKCILFEIPDDSYLLFLNAGDELLPWNNEIVSVENFDVAYLSVIQKLVSRDFGKIVNSDIKMSLSEKTFMPTTIFRHQGFLIKMGVFRKYKYDLNVGQQADGLLMSLCQKNEHFGCFNLPIAVFYLDGISNSNYLVSLKSYFKVVRKLGFSRMNIVYYQKQYILRMLVKIVLPLFLVRFVMNLKLNRK
jgi:glycosyltransferase involved in cell wall biosynthesis